MSTDSIEKIAEYAIAAGAVADDGDEIGLGNVFRIIAQRLRALPSAELERDAGRVKVGELIVTEHKGDLYYAWSRDGYARPAELGTYDLLARANEAKRQEVGR